MKRTEATKGTFDAFDEKRSYGFCYEIDFFIILNCVQLQKLCCGQKLLNIFIKEFCKTIQKIEI